MKIFLGGTCNGSTWRDGIIPLLKIEYFNPMVDSWSEADYQRELDERATCDYFLYVITPRMKGVYAIAEIIDDSNKQPEKTMFCFLEHENETSFTPVQLRSLESVGKMAADNGARWFRSFGDLRDYLSTLGAQPL